MIIKLERHARSMHNDHEVDSRNISDLLVPITSAGPAQAIKAGAEIGADYIKNSLVYCSPYLRTRQTLAWSLIGAGLAEASELDGVSNLGELALLADAEGKAALAANPRGILDAEADALKSYSQLADGESRLGAIIRQISKREGISYYEDVRLREVEHGLGEVDEQELKRKIHTYFFYRLEAGGESPADGYDRVSTFLESLARQCRRKKKEQVWIVSHGLLMRLFVMRFLHLSIEEFNTMRTPRNGSIVTITYKNLLHNPQFTNGRYGVVGLRMRD